MTEISILGCGWLGLPLGKSLSENGFSVKGSTTSDNRISILKDNGIDPFVISLSSENVHGEIEKFLASEILIINIPPKIAEGNFTDKIRNLIPFIQQSSIEKVLFVSSISVYGKNSGTVTEDAIPEPDSENGRQILEAENLLKSGNFKTSILRFGGLIGNDRHPVKYMAGKSGLENPDAPVNLIHLDDCIGIIQRIIAVEAWNEIFNAVTPFHPTRETYYKEQAEKLGLSLPSFDQSKISEGKTVDSKKLIQTLPYTFQNNLK